MPMAKKDPPGTDPAQEERLKSSATAVRDVSTAHTLLPGPSRYRYSTLRYSQCVLFLQPPPEAYAPGNLCSASAPQPAGG